MNRCVYGSGTGGSHLLVFGKIQCSAVLFGLTQSVSQELQRALFREPQNPFSKAFYFGGGDVNYILSMSLYEFVWFPVSRKSVSGHGVPFWLAASECCLNSATLGLPKPDPYALRSRINPSSHLTELMIPRTYNPKP